MISILCLTGILYMHIDIYRVHKFSKLFISYILYKQNYVNSCTYHHHMWEIRYFAIHMTPFKHPNETVNQILKNIHFKNKIPIFL